MKLTTSIQPRRDGTVSVTAIGQTYVFKAAESGDMECDVVDKQAIAALLETGNFYPANEADFDAALSVIEATGTKVEGAAMSAANEPPAAASASRRKVRAAA